MTEREREREMITFFERHPPCHAPKRHVDFHRRAVVASLRPRLAGLRREALHPLRQRRGVALHETRHGSPDPTGPNRATTALRDKWNEGMRGKATWGDPATAMTSSDQALPAFFGNLQLRRVGFFGVRCGPPQTWDVGNFQEIPHVKWAEIPRL